MFVALQAIAYVSLALAGLFQKKCGVEIINGIYNLIQKNPSMNVQAMIASCFGQFCAVDTISKKIFKDTLPNLVNWLLSLCGAPQPAVQTEAINAISHLSRATKNDFSPYFHQITQGLLNILGSPVNDNISVHIAASSCLCTCLSIYHSFIHS